MKIVITHSNFPEKYKADILNIVMAPNLRKTLKTHSFEMATIFIDMRFTNFHFSSVQSCSVVVIHSYIVVETFDMLQLHRVEQQVDKVKTTKNISSL